MNSLDSITLWIGNAENLHDIRTVPPYFTQHERDRFHAFKFGDLGQFYAKVHRSVRVHLAEFLRLKPEEIAIRHRACPSCNSLQHGPPYLDTPLGDLHFTLSKSTPHFIFGIAPFPLGVDIETPTRAKEGDLIGGLAFCKEELTVLESNDASLLALKWWVRKEAVLKACGSGLCDDPSQLDVSHETRPGLCFTEHRDTVWRIEDLDIPYYPLELSLAFANCSVTPDLDVKQI